MKRVLVMNVIVVALFASCITPQKADTELLKYSENVSVVGVSKDELFAKVNLWMINALKEEQSKIERSDGGAGVITATHTFLTLWGIKSMKFKTLVLTTVTINVNNNGYTLNFSNPKFKAFTNTTATPDGWTRTEPLDGSLVADTRAVWFDLAEGLRSTVSGTLVSN